MSGDRLPRDVFVALAAIAWADGKLDPEEADAIVRTALEEGLELEEIAEIEEATKHPAELGVVMRGNMSKTDRLFVYAVACWMARLDGALDDRETAALARLGEALRVPPTARAHADAISREIAALPEGDRPHRYDLRLLRETLGRRLDEARARRALEEELE